MPLPAIKLITLVGKQLVGKPIANLVKEKAKKSPFFRDRIVMPAAQFYTTTFIKLRSRLLGIGKVQSVEPVSTERAVELLGDFLGELTIIAIAVFAIHFELSRQKQNVKDSHDVCTEKIEFLKAQVEQLALCVKQQGLDQKNIEKTIENLNMTIFYSQQGITSKILAMQEEAAARKDSKSKS